MAVIEGEKSIDVAAPPQACFDVVVDFDSYPQWQDAVQRVEVHERDAEGRPVRVTQHYDAKVRTISFELRYEHTEPSEVRWSYVDGDIKDLSGRWRFEQRGDRETHVVYELRMDTGRTLGLLVRGPVAGRLRDELMDRTLTELKARVESRG